MDEKSYKSCKNYNKVDCYGAECKSCSEFRVVDTLVYVTNELQSILDCDETMENDIYMLNDALYEETVLSHIVDNCLHTIRTLQITKEQIYTKVKNILWAVIERHKGIFVDKYGDIDLLYDHKLIIIALDKFRRCTEELLYALEKEQIYAFSTSSEIKIASTTFAVVQPLLSLDMYRKEIILYVKQFVDHIKEKLNENESEVK